MPMDLIDRKNTIDAMENVDWYHQNRSMEMVHGANSDDQAWYKAEDVYEVLERMPSVHPETDLQSTCNEVATDCISRQAAIEKLKREFNETDVPDRYPGIFDAIEEWLSERELPSAQPEIILCKDCAWGMTGEFSKNFFCSRTGALTWAEPDSFCNYAERKKDG